MLTPKRKRAASGVRPKLSKAFLAAPGGLDELATAHHRRSRDELVGFDESDFSDEDREEEEWRPTVKAKRRAPKSIAISKEEIERVDAAVPCHGKFLQKQVYNGAHRSRPRLAAYVEFPDVRDLDGHMLTAAFLPAYAVFKETGLVPFKDIVSVLQDPARLDEREELVNDLARALEKRRAKRDGNAEILGDAIWWLVYKSADVKYWSREEQDDALDIAHEALRNWYPTINTLPRKYLDKNSILPVWQHELDPQPEVEQYNRALQLLRCCERMEHVGFNQTKGKSKAEKWVGALQDRSVLGSRPVSKELVPDWMKGQVDGDDLLAESERTDEECQTEEDIDVSDATAQRNHVQASERDHVQEDTDDEEIMVGIEQGQPQEQPDHGTTTERGIPPEARIKGEDYTTPIVIIDDDEIKVEDDTAPIGAQQDDKSSSKSACSILYITNRKISRARCRNKKWFDECWEEMECLDAPTNNKIATADPRDWLTSEEWRDAVRKELRLGTHWRRGEDEGLALKLTALRLRAGDEKLDCYDCKARQFCSTPDQVSEFVDKHQNCELEYCIDFFTEEEMANGNTNDLETLNLP
ncbi:hypothetical protein CB0940_10017 [Cercospora beticola]|uniref:Uncharacterized protein n=1 Tax=Cercospora beticola TaxID=122368 RepID=A0A2G5HI91_CERBT|nr:hypothetical protein CB0940_10017 [Cercospora beticola]PIA92284.1 hypothetical protein CB0940_10017 [Cercospora beticola]WPB05626.1 hypothetical protein RHO25_010279 [Cercospora beticola]